MTDSEFKAYMVGFTGGEGSFLIGKVKDTDNFYFRFSIKLHVDDLKALEYIQSKLGCGIVFTSGNSANFCVTKLSDLKEILIPLFEEKSFP